MEKIIAKSNKSTILRQKRDMDIHIVNQLTITLDCDVELSGNTLTIWIREEKDV